MSYTVCLPHHVCRPVHERRSLWRTLMGIIDHSERGLVNVSNSRWSIDSVETHAQEPFH